MRAAPDSRKPVAFPLTGSREIEVLGGKIDIPSITETLVDRQADRVLRRWKVSVPLARYTAELAFGTGGPS